MMSVAKQPSASKAPGAGSGDAVDRFMSAGDFSFKAFDSFTENSPVGPTQVKSAELVQWYLDAYIAKKSSLDETAKCLDLLAQYPYMPRPMRFKLQVMRRLIDNLDETTSKKKLPQSVFVLANRIAQANFGRTSKVVSIEKFLVSKAVEVSMDSNETYVLEYLSVVGKHTKRLDVHVEFFVSAAAYLSNLSFKKHDRLPKAEALVEVLMCVAERPDGASVMVDSKAGSVHAALIAVVYGNSSSSILDPKSVSSTRVQSHAVSALANLSRWSLAHEALENANLANVFLELLKNLSKTELSMRVLMGVAFLSGKSEDGPANAELSSSNLIERIVKLLKASIESELKAAHQVTTGQITAQRPGQLYVYSRDELTHALRNLAVSDDHKSKLFQAGAVDVVFENLEFELAHDLEKTTGTEEEDALYLSVSFLLHMSFNSSALERMGQKFEEFKVALDEAQKSIKARAETKKDAGMLKFKLRTSGRAVQQASSKKSKGAKKKKMMKKPPSHVPRARQAAAEVVQMKPSSSSSATRKSEMTRSRGLFGGSFRSKSKLAAAPPAAAPAPAPAPGGGGAAPPPAAMSHALAGLDFDVEGGDDDVDEEEEEEEEDKSLFSKQEEAARVDEGLDAEAKLEPDSYAMISYSWAQQSQVKKIVDFLGHLKTPVWVDYQRMSGDITDAMADAVENCKIFVLCASPEYKESANCRLEANYAHSQGKTIVPVMMTARYRASGWLGIILGTKLYVEVAQFEQGLTRAMKRHELTDVDVSAEIPQENEDDSQLSDVSDFLSSKGWAPDEESSLFRALKESFTPSQLSTIVSLSTIDLKGCFYALKSVLPSCGPEKILELLFDLSAWPTEGRELKSVSSSKFLSMLAHSKDNGLSLHFELFPDSPISDLLDAFARV